MALRESPVRRRSSARPPWLIPVLAVVGVLVVIGLGFGVMSLLRGPSDSTAADTGSEPAPCVTTSVAASSLLPVPAKVKVNVYNATATSGLASKTASAVEKRGFVVATVGNDPAGAPITGVAEIRYGPKAEAEANLLLAYVPGARMVPLDRKGRKVDLAVGDAFTGLAPQSAVDATLAAPTPIASGPGCPSSPSAAASPAVAPSGGSPS